MLASKDTFCPLVHLFTEGAPEVKVNQSPDTKELRHAPLTSGNQPIAPALFKQYTITII